MLIDIDKNNIILQDNTGNLKPYQLSQIGLLGFKKSNNSVFLLDSLNHISILKKITEYLDEEKILYILSPICQEIFNNHQKRIEDFQELKKSGIEFKNNIFKNDLFNEFRIFIKNNIKRKLKDHQIKSAYHLYSIKNGANFSVPGSGKTSVVLSVFEYLRFKNSINTLFVIGPPSCFGPWKAEFHSTLGRDPRYKILAGGDYNQRKNEYYVSGSQKGELYLSTYQTLLNDIDDAVNFFRQKDNRVFLVVDEAHYMKQIGGSWSNAILSIAKYADYRCILTGTPLPRSYRDVFNLFDFLYPDINPISEDLKINIQLYEDKGDIQQIKENLKSAIDPLFYRVRKKDLGLLPQKFHPPIVLQMNNYEHILYEAIEKKIRTYSKQDYLKNIELVKKLRRGRIIRLRQCVSYVKLITTALKDYEENLIESDIDLSEIIRNYDELEVPLKIQFLVNQVKGLQENGQKVVIWANFIDTLKLISHHLTKSGFYSEMIYGDIPTEQTAYDNNEKTRERIRDEFVDPNSGLNILIANPAACAESISLHKTCFHSIYYDLSYNCAQYLQSLDRIHRVGGSESNQANYYFLQYKNTIDQDILENLNNKAKKMNDLIEDEYKIYSLDMFDEDDEDQAFERLFTNING